VTFEYPALLPGGFPLETKLLIEAFLWYSSSIAFLRLWRRKKNAPPAIAPMRTIPTTTPAMIPVVFAFDFLSLASASAAAETDAAWAGAVMVMTDPSSVITDGAADVVVDAVEGAEAEAEADEVSDEESVALATSVASSVPVSQTVKNFPFVEPHEAVPKPEHPAEHLLSATSVSAGGLSLPHQQSVFLVKPSTA